MKTTRMTRWMTAAALFGLVASCVSVFSPELANAEKVTYVANDPSKRDKVSFLSDAPIELIQGNTHNVQGVVEYDDSFIFDRAHPFDIRFEVDLASLDTGIPLRNQHLRDNYLQTNQYPKAVFVAKKIETSVQPPFSDLKKVRLTAIGDFTVHGVTVQKTIPMTVTYYKEGRLSHQRYSAGDMIRMKAKFMVNLKEHNIEIPQFLAFKLAEEVEIDFDVTATNQAKKSGVKKPF